MSKKELSDVLVPPFAAGVRILDSDNFYTSGNVNLRTADSKVEYVQEGDWFRREDYDRDFNGIEETQVLLDPRTGYLLNDIQRINHKVGIWATGSGHPMAWSGGDAIGKLHTLRKQDYNKISCPPYRSRYFIRTSKGTEVILGEGKRVESIAKVGDHLITVTLSGDNFFGLQLLKPDPTATYELRGVYCKPHEGRPEGAFIISAYHMGQDVAPIQVTLKRG